MRVHFSKVRAKNFLSVGNDFLETSIDKYNKTLIVGKNASGKSSLMDQICFGLFGKPYRDIKKDLIINSINKKACLVEVEFSVGTNHFLVRRGISPNVFEIYQNGDLIKQNASTKEYQANLEKYILGMDIKTFKQTVILGSANYQPFMQLPKADRREVVESLLDIKMFSAMTMLVKNELSDVKKEELTVDTKLNSAKSFFRTQRELLLNLRSANENKDTVNQAKIDQKRNLMDAAIESLKEKSAELAEKRTGFEPKDFFSQISYNRSQQAVIDAQLASDRKQIEFFTDHTDCPTCLQPISEEFREREIAELREKDFEWEDMRKKHTTEIESLMKEKQSQDLIQRIIQDAENETNRLKSSIRQYDAELRFLKSNSSDTNDSEAEVIKSIEKIGAEIKDLSHKKEELLIEIESKSIVLSMLKDSGVKGKVIGLYIPLMNKYINKYLNDLNFFAQFTLNNEFDEEIKSRFRDEFQYNSFSEGEKLRIDFSILFAWREIAKTKNSVSSNLLLMDEIMDGSIDNDGAEDFMRLLNTLGDTNIFIISHRPELISDKFNRVIKVTKPGNFTQVTEELQ